MSKQGKNKRPKPRRRRPPTKVEAATPLSTRMMFQLNEIVDLIDEGDLAEAEQRLVRLDRKDSYADVVELMVALYQEMDEHEKMAVAAERWARLAPNDPDAKVYFAQSSMLCGRACVALLAYREFIERFPDHEHSVKVQEALEVVAPEAQRRIERAGLDADEGIRLFAMHETSVMHLANSEFEKCVEICKHLCEAAPHFASPHNNLALASLHLGKLREATAIAERTRTQFPGNGFVAASLIKFYFLAARNEDANAIANELVAAPPTGYSDAYLATLESLALLGRDRDIIDVCQNNTKVDLVDPIHLALASHYLAYAHCRLDEPTEARKHWQAAIKAMPEFPEANDNLRPTDEQREHVPWADPVQKWVPRKLLEKHARDRSVFSSEMLVNVIATLLDRGDPNGREMGLELALFDITPAIAETLRAFALGKRGPLDMRMRALHALKEEGLIDAGSHRIFVTGEFTDIELLTTEIHDEVDRHSNQEFSELMEQGGLAMGDQEFDIAEKCFQKAIELEPDVPIGHYNLASVWLRRDGRAGSRKGREKIEWIHQQHPDYAFAAIAMAQFKARDGDTKTAMKMLEPFFKMPRLHISEAKALYVSQIQILMEAEDWDAARKSLVMLKQICDDDDPLTSEIEQKLDRLSRKKILGLL